jgi:hypothetical protein
MKKVKRFRCPIYGTSYVVLLKWALEKAKQYVESRYEIKFNPGAGSAGYTIAFSGHEGFEVILWTAPDSGFPELSHEMIHAANFTLQHVGVHATLEQDEAQAYYVEYLMRQTLKGAKACKTNHNH